MADKAHIVLHYQCRLCNECVLHAEHKLCSGYRLCGECMLIIE